ncbi:GntR family transcriptional regulator [Streptomyces sp. NPDC051784]|uniref:GntR family transcriptional regulator n=1 Tax=Streptomyces sp. NPDC051784 TaxID=3155805 RepID=UPI0034420152
MAGTKNGWTAGGTPDLSELAAHSTSLERSGTAERVAAVLRDRITEGYFPPGSRLSEESISGALAVSRNTLREAFRLLSHERLLEHRLNRGVFVRVLAVDDVVDIYRVRLLVECAALRTPADPPWDLSAVEAAVCAGEEAALRDDWPACSTANIRFHQALAGLAGSPRTDELMRNVLAELRLAFHVMADPRRFHEPYLTRNRDITDRLTAGDAAGAERALAFYLEDSRRQVAEAYAQRLTER